MIKYSIESIGFNHVFGWAYDPDLVEEPVEIVVKTQRGEITVMADLFRSHLQQANIASGKAGFVVTLQKEDRKSVV